MATMTTLTYTVRFLTPAFLGDAEQTGRWRTPPFKALLRQWWRVAYAADHNFNVHVNDMRREEGLLFGNAWLNNDFRKSLVRLRLDRWDEGQLKKTQWPADPTVSHPEVTRPIGSSLYLGYGPLTFAHNTVLKTNAAIQAGEAATLAIAFPTSHKAPELRGLIEANCPRLKRALWLMDRYGTVGGRSRNGWGAFMLTPSNGAQKLGGSVPLREWKACLDCDWPHAIGQDEKGPLIWQTPPHDDWKALMKTLAIIKIGLRTQFAFTGSHASIPEDRHWLSYPVTNHSVATWDAEVVQGKRHALNLRLPNQLRFKVREENGHLVGVIFHMPHLPPKAFKPNSAAIVQVWKCVHEFLDALTKPPQERHYCQMADNQALAKQKTQLDQVLLQGFRSKP